MGLWVRDVVNVADGTAFLIEAPAGTRGVKRMYVTSTNITHLSVETPAGMNDILKAPGTALTDMYPLNQQASRLKCKTNGIAVAEDVTVLSEWE